MQPKSLLYKTETKTYLQQWLTQTIVEQKLYTLNMYSYRSSSIALKNQIIYTDLSNNKM